MQVTFDAWCLFTVAFEAADIMERARPVVKTFFCACAKNLRGLVE
jgi:hypothetical protein